MIKSLSKYQIDAIKEVATIGAGNAATALSQMLKKRTNITVPKVSFVKIADASKIFGGDEQIVTAVYLQLLGDITGVVLFSFGKEEAIKLSDMLQGKKPYGKSKLLNEMGQSSLKEAASILTGAYLNAMSKLLKMRLLISSPALATDMAGAMIDGILTETNNEADHSIIINTEFDIVEEKIMAFFCFIPDAKSMKPLIDRLGV